MPKEKIESPQYMDWLYKNTGGKMGRPMQTPNIVPEIPKEAPRKYERPSNWLPKLLVGLGGGNPAFIDQIQAQNEENDAMNDPMSERSILARGIAKRLGANVGDSSSARDVSGYLPILEKIREMELRRMGGAKEKPTSEKVKGEYGERVAGLNALIQNQNLLKKSPEVSFGKEIAYKTPWLGDFLKSKMSPEDVATASEIGKNVNLSVRGANAGFQVTDADFERLSPFFASPFERNERAIEKNLSAIREQAQAQKNRAESDYRLGMIDSKTYQEAINSADNALRYAGGGDRVFTITDPKTGDSTQTSDPQLAEAARKRGARVQ